MRIAAIIQARASSERFPRKVFANVGRWSVLRRIINELKRCENLDDIILAYPSDESKYFSTFDGIEKSHGSRYDVMGRMIKTADRFGVDAIVRVCADSPFILGWLIDVGVEMFRLNDIDYLNTICFPKGQNIEVVRVDALKRAYKKTNKEEREHVTLYLERNSDEFKCKTLNVELTLDEEGDLPMLQKVAKYYDR